MRRERPLGPKPETRAPNPGSRAPGPGPARGFGRIAIATDEISQDLAECRAFLEKHGLRSIDLRVVGGRRVPDLSERDLGTLRGWVRAGEVEVVAVSPGTFKCPLSDGSEVRRHLEDVLPRAIDLAMDLRACLLVTFGFHDDPRGGVPPAAADILRRASDRCAAAGLPLLLENEPGTLASTGREIQAVLAAVDHPGLFLVWDPSNSLELETERLAGAAKALAGRIRHVHVKNGRWGGDGVFRCGPLREGLIDWPAHLALLSRLGYAGYLSIETHYLPFKEGSETVLGELREMLAAMEDRA